MSSLSSVVQGLDGITSRLADLADNPDIPYERLVISLSAVTTIWELYVSSRQMKCYSIPLPPPELQHHLKKETYDKAQAYGKDKLTFNVRQTMFNFVLGVVVIKTRLLPHAWDWTASFMDLVGLDQSRVITHSLLWITATSLVSVIPNLFWTYHFTFVIEEKHGFNKTTKKLWITDQIKTFAIAIVLGLPFLAGFLKVIEMAGKNFVPWLMLFMISVQLILQIIYPIFIQPLFNKLTPLPEGDVRQRVEKLANKLQFPLKHLYVIDGSKRSSHSNAYFYGLPWSKQIVLYDTLLDQNTPPEVEAVLAHELGHWKFWHPARLLLIAQSNLLWTLGLFAVFIHNKSLFASFGFDPRLAVGSPVGGPQPILIGFTLYQLLFEPLDTFVKFFINSKTRKYEYQADQFAMGLGHAKDLGAALIKLHIENLSSPHSDKLFSKYHHSHPTLPERLRAMNEYKGGDWLSKNQSSKVEEIKAKEKKEL
ncbi:hypothetical protein CcaverHIS002_0109650 [Cutaneotrichosporon cavernicola]|uniref:CAAX prenyl protease n=1 Tax=Cutaneotrichosporon cavernicola TaxID=279322 RepID=A0AA48HZA6_9TREE|nr:uncharacterized protein CcaverHIS019_0109590 [Cutaneotrichosporon cavernicola]BEI80436.1 hypothetical protein CcaverHIS002_0109650 [Cutaneotrichosporon cavernicola]BEI88241.1 hypothetical protein CcaverHIS019_0109590 [Cutaneotrichosporon cavernicola]BEI96012.1 hypothetical protein CcaverHIS631_0109610 [Cutaneotrichosporon cavernicola]BEJ03786.1 hypothetical protein CcaverHIS641_0109610 [Cutaneotrichosporon cavernicola]